MCLGGAQGVLPQGVLPHRKEGHCRRCCTGGDDHSREVICSPPAASPPGGDAHGLDAVCSASAISAGRGSARGPDDVCPAPAVSPRRGGARGPNGIYSAPAVSAGRGGARGPGGAFSAPAVSPRRGIGPGLNAKKAQQPLRLRRSHVRLAAQPSTVTGGGARGRGAAVKESITGYPRVLHVFTVEGCAASITG